ncbi:MAG: hypothetical protein U9N87_12695, partial [Planctomycetota bacterium]|nr:hypothetical protein [Planctomycetota bacterium]
MARDKIREKFEDTAREKMDEIREDFEAGEGQAESEADLSVDVGLVYALAIEAGGTVDLLDSFQTTRGSGFTAQLGCLAGGQ